MNTYTTLHIGEHHVNFCEDYLLITSIGTNKMLCAVMDGCTMGTDSYFASTLTGRILRKVAKALYFREFAEKESSDPRSLLKTVLRDLFEDLNHARELLQLERNEMLSTLLIGIIDTEKRSGEFMCIGDGLLCVDQHFYEFEQDNKPDYLGYHLKEDFEAWFASQQQRISFENMNDCSLATDGIFTFSKFNQEQYPDKGSAIDYLLIDRGNESAPNMLDRKMMEIKSAWGLVPADDLAIVRIIF